MARATAWAIAGSGPTLVASGAIVAVDVNALTSFSLSGSANLRGYTLTRVIGDVAVRPNAGNALGIQEFAMGLMVIQGSGTPDINPLTDDGPWLWHFRGGIGQDLNSQEVLSRYFSVDSKAQRLYRTQESKLWFMFQNGPTAGSLNHVWGLRLLYRIP